MSVNDTVNNNTYGITIEVPESLVEEIISKGKKPPLILSKLIQRMISEMNTNEIIDFSEGIISEKQDIKNKEKKPRRLLPSQSWTSLQFNNYIQNLVSHAEKKASYGDLISMLIAYLDTNTRPTSEELREARGFGPGGKWYEELRTAKARLTILAKHMNLPSFFSRAYGSGLNRRHPINNNIYKFLSKWADENPKLIAIFRKRGTPRSADH